MVETAEVATARLCFRGGAAAALAGGSAFGVALPRQPCRAEQQGARAALWLGPDEWLLLCATHDADAVAAAIAAAVQVPHALLDVGDRQVGYVLTGSAAPTVLQAGCPLDLSARAFPVGACTRTLLGKAEIVLWRRAPDQFQIEVWRSFAPFVARLLDEACGDWC